MTSPVAPLDNSTRLAVDRTRLAYERTMMAWVRTGTSLISFGFSIHKFFQLQIERNAVTNHRLGPRGFALIMIATGLLALLLATIEHRQSMQSLRATFGPQPRSVAAVVAAIVSILGLAAFVSVLFRA